MFKKSIKAKMIAGFMAVAIFSLSITGVIFIHLFKTHIIDTKKIQMEKWAYEIAGYLLSSDVSSRRIMKSPEVLKLLSDFSETDVWIIDSSGIPFSITSRGGKHDENMNLPLEAKEVIKGVLEGKATISEGFSDKIFKEHTLTIGVPIVDQNNQVIGALLLHSPTRGITAVVEKAEILLFGVAILSLLIAFVIGIFYSNALTKPLNKLKQSSIEMAEGNYSVRSQVDSLDEIGDLGKCFDALGEKLGLTIEELYQEKSKLNDIISSMSEGLLAVDEDCHVINYNAAYLKHTKSDIIEISSELREHLLMVKESGLSHSDTFEVKGNILSYSSSPIKNSEGLVLGVVSTIIDISEKERLEAMRKSFVTDVSHEFRTPLTIIRGTIESITDHRVDQDDLFRNYEIILNETSFLEHLVADLLDLSQLDHDKIALNLERLSLNDVIDDSLRGLRVLAQTKNISIEFIPYTDIQVILGDYTRLKQILTIFIENAIKYSDESGMIQILTESQDETAVIRIEDHGPGIHMEELQLIWERFYRSDSARNQKNGTGLGLSIAKRLIALHGGQVDMISEPGIGTQVILSLPLQK